MSTSHKSLCSLLLISIWRSTVAGAAFVAVATDQSSGAAVDPDRFLVWIDVLLVLLFRCH